MPRIGFHTISLIGRCVIFMFRGLRKIHIVHSAAIRAVITVVVHIQGHAQVHHVHVHSTVVLVVGVCVHFRASWSDVISVQMRRIKATLQKLVEDIRVNIAFVTRVVVVGCLFVRLHLI